MHCALCDARRSASGDTELPAQFDPAQFNPKLMWTEYLNHLPVVMVGFLIRATVVSAWRHHRGHRQSLGPLCGIAAHRVSRLARRPLVNSVFVQSGLSMWSITRKSRGTF
jgi:hypothetical protein